MEAILYATMLVVFFGLSFYILRATRLEEAFKKGHVTEIRIAYFVISFIMAFLLTELVSKLLSFANLNL